MEKEELYMCTFVDRKKGTSTLSKIVDFDKPDKSMTFPDSHIKEYLNEIIPLGTIRKVTKVFK